MRKFLLFPFLITTLGLSSVLAQSITLDPYGVSPRDVARDTVALYFDRAYNGLLNVGIETKMYFKGHFEDSSLTTPTWSLFIQPLGSVATLGTTMDMDSATQVISLIPDVVGTYKVAFSDGALSDTLTINAGTYLGVEGGTVNCVGCHNTSIWDYKYDEWLETGHSSMLIRGLNGTLSSHYGENCISCHTVGYDPNANNGGFDDFPFVFPDSLFVGQYDLTKAAYPEAMGLANIQCESCHGPGSEHFGLTSASQISNTLSTDNCALCHDSGTHHAFPEQWDYAGHDATEFDGRGFHGGHSIGAFKDYAGGRTSCAPCHSGAGFVAWVKGGKAPLTEAPTPTLITCATCHDPHDATNEHQLRIAEVELGDGTVVTYDQYGTGVLCMNCHRSRRDAKTYAEDPDNASTHFGAHHGPEADLLLGVNAPDFGVEFRSSPHAVAVLPGEPKGNACVNCHMAGELADAEGNINLVGGHSWNMNDAEGNDHVEACAPCHGDIGTSFKDKKYYINGDADLDGNGTAEGLQVEVHGLLEELGDLLPHDDEGNVRIIDDNVEGIVLTPAIVRSGYVYFWIEEDRSFGIHNPAFTIGLLVAAIENLGGVTAIDFDDIGVPQEYQLSQNYPNPFNPTTTIKYALPEHSDVNITIYDVLGNEVEVLFSGQMTAGVHSVTWNATSYASGIYFYRMTAGNNVQVNKMILMK